MDVKERENFNKNSTLIVEHTKEGFTDLIDLNTKLSAHGSFEDFINAKQHDIYHLCYNRSHCCQCPKGYLLPKSRVLHPPQLEHLLNKNGPKKMCHNPNRTGDFCCCFAHRGLTTSVLDVTLARCLLVNFCPDVFWYSSLNAQKRTFEDFLTHNKHHIYHLYDINKPCCQCPPCYVFPSPRQQLIYFQQWNNMFGNKCLPCPLDRKRTLMGARTICASVVTPGIKESHLNPELAKLLLGQCCVLTQKVEELVKLRNNAFGHVKEAKISNNDFTKYRYQIERNLKFIAKICNNESEVQQKLDSLDRRTLDGTLLLQTIKEQLHIAEEISSMKGEITTRMDLQSEEIMTKIVHESLDIKDKIKTKMDLHGEKIATKVDEASADIKEDITTKMAAVRLDIKETITTRLSEECDEVKIKIRKLMTDQTTEITTVVGQETSNLKEGITSQLSNVHSDIKEDIKTRMVQEGANITTRIAQENSDLKEDITTKISKVSLESKEDIKDMMIQECLGIKEHNKTEMKKNQEEITTTLVKHIDTKFIKMEKMYEKLSCQKELDVVKRQIEEKRNKLLEKTEKLIRTHTNDNTFVNTSVVDKAWSCLKQNGIVVLIGSPGVGKSRIGLELLTRQITSGDVGGRCIQLDDISLWNDMSTGMDVVFIDDAFGKTNCIYNHDSHSPLMDMIFIAAENDRVNVILSLRNNIYQTIASVVESHRIFHGKHILDLCSSENQITVDEKQLCLMKYFTKNKIMVTDDPLEENIKDDSVLDPDSTVYLSKDTVHKILRAESEQIMGFHEACCLFASHRKFTVQGHKFFYRPTEHLSREINTLMKDGYTNKGSMIDFTLLVYILINSESIDVHEIDLQIFREIMETLYLDPPSSKLQRSHINISAKQLSGKYLRITSEGNYCFQHRIISEAVMIFYNDADPMKVIPLLKFDFIVEMARPEFYQPRKGEVVIGIPLKCYNLLAQRLVRLLETDYEKNVIMFIQNLCRSQILAMTNDKILHEMTTQYKHNRVNGHSELLHDHRLKENQPFYLVDAAQLYLPVALMMFCDIDNDSVYECLYESIHNTLISESDRRGLRACRESLVTAFNFAICTLDLKRSTVILNMMKEHNIKQNRLQFNFCYNITKCQGVSAVQLIYHLNGLGDVFDTTSLFIEIFKNFTRYVKHIDDDMKQFITSFVSKKNHDKLQVRALVKFVCACGQLDFVEYVCKSFDSSLYDVNEMIKVSCEEIRIEVVRWLIENYYGLYNVQQALGDACIHDCIEGFLVVFDKADHTLLDMKQLMNTACSRGNTGVVKWLCEKFKNDLKTIMKTDFIECLYERVNLVKCDLFDMTTAMDNACSSGNTELVEWLCGKFDNKVFDMKSAMNNACSSGNSDIVKWLVEKLDNKLFDMKTAMNNACKKIHNTELVKWLFGKFDINAFDMKEAMKNACSNALNDKLVRWMCKTFDNDLFDMKSVMNYTGSSDHSKFNEWLDGDYTVLLI